MAEAEEELEAQLVEIGNMLASPPSAAEELISLLDQAEILLSRVEQAPSESMSAALYPVMKALMANELLSHSETDVKVSLASCFSEITRITAPDAPYNDELMKDIFQMIVDAFVNIDDLSSPSHHKRVSILDTIANVRSCVLMLDLGCDDLILEMFQSFLKTIRATHTRNVFSSMESIMTLMLKESDDISSELLSCLLDSVEKDNNDILPTTRRLGQNVIGNCAEKLKPYLIELVQSKGASSNGYGNIITSVHQENSDTSDLNGSSASGECMESVRLESEVSYPEDIGSLADKSSILSNGILQTGNSDTMTGTRPLKQKPESYHGNGHSKIFTAAAIAEFGDLSSSMVLEPDCNADYITKKRMEQKGNSFVELRDSTGNSQGGSDENLSMLSRRRDHSKEVDGPSGIKADASLCVGAEKLKPPLDLDSEKLCIASLVLRDKSRGKTRAQKDRHATSKISTLECGVNVVAGQATITRGQKRALDNDQNGEEKLPSEGIKSKKDDGFMCDSVGKPVGQSCKSMHNQTIDDGETKVVDVNLKETDEKIDSKAKDLLCTSRTRLKRNLTERESSEQQKSKIEQATRKKRVRKHLAGQRSLESSRTKSRTKRTRDTEEVSEAQNPNRELDETLIGSKIEVWWPDDEMFYEGVVDSFNPVTKKHKVLYFDGDVEILLLKDENWRFLKDDKTDVVQEQAKEIPRSDAFQEMTLKKSKTRTLDSVVHQTKFGKPLKSGGRSAGESKAYVSRSGGKGVDNVRSTRSRLKDGTPNGSRRIEDMFKDFRSKAKDREKLNDIKTSSLGTEQPGDQSEDDIVMLGSKFEGLAKDKPFRSDTVSKDGKQGSFSKCKEVTPPKSVNSKETNSQAGSKPKRSSSRRKSESDSTHTRGMPIKQETIDYAENLPLDSEKLQENDVSKENSDTMSKPFKSYTLSKDGKHESFSKSKEDPIQKSSNSDVTNSQAGSRLKRSSTRIASGKSDSDSAHTKRKPIKLEAGDFDENLQLDYGKSQKHSLMMSRKRHRMSGSCTQS